MLKQKKTAREEDERNFNKQGIPASMLINYKKNPTQKERNINLETAQSIDG